MNNKEKRRQITNAIHLFEDFIDDNKRNIFAQREARRAIEVLNIEYESLFEKAEGFVNSSESTKENIEKHLDLLIRKLRAYYNPHEPQDVSKLIDEYVLATQEGIGDVEFYVLYEKVKMAWRHRTPTEFSMEIDSIDLDF